MKLENIARNIMGLEFGAVEQFGAERKDTAKMQMPFV
jgi:hypothetical protein